MRRLFYYLSPLSILLLVLTAAPIISQADAESGAPFRDVPANYWANDAIDTFVQLGIIRGFPDHTYRPQDAVTREQFAQLITETFYLDLPDQATSSFADVSADRWSSAAIEAAKAYLTGYYPPNGQAFFDPSGQATREDVAVALVSALGYMSDDVADNKLLARTFVDSDQVSPHLRAYLTIAVEQQLLSGYEDATLRPQDPVTRAEAAALLNRVLKRAVADGDAELQLYVSAPERTASPTFYITGDVSPGAQVWVNQDRVEVSEGKFRFAVQLTDEGYYPYTVVAKSLRGQQTSRTLEVIFEREAPRLEVGDLPSRTDAPLVWVPWSVVDAADPAPLVYINEVQATSSPYAVTLDEGYNVVKIRSVNRFGKETTVLQEIEAVWGELDQQ